MKMIRAAKETSGATRAYSIDVPDDADPTKDLAGLRGFINLLGVNLEQLKSLEAKGQLLEDSELTDLPDVPKVSKKKGKKK